MTTLSCHRVRSRAYRFFNSVLTLNPRPRSQFPALANNILTIGNLIVHTLHAGMRSTALYLSPPAFNACFIGLWLWYRCHSASSMVRMPLREAGSGIHDCCSVRTRVKISKRHGRTLKMKFLKGSGSPQTELWACLEASCRACQSKVRSQNLVAYPGHLRPDVLCGDHLSYCTVRAPLFAECSHGEGLTELRRQSLNISLLIVLPMRFRIVSLYHSRGRQSYPYQRRG